MLNLIKKITIFLILILININISVYADPVYEEKKIKTTQIEITAQIPPDFEKIIYVNFILDDGTNYNYVLNKNNNYKCVDIIKVGSANVNFINILDNSENRYNYYCENDILNIVEGEKVEFSFKVQDLKSKVSEVTIKKKEEIEEDHKEEEIRVNKDDINEKNNENSKNNSIKSLLIDGVVSGILCIILCIIKYKKNRGDL